MMLCTSHLKMYWRIAQMHIVHATSHITLIYLLNIFIQVISVLLDVSLITQCIHIQCISQNVHFTIYIFTSNELCSVPRTVCGHTHIISIGWRWRRWQVIKQMKTIHWPTLE